ncbi:MAG: CehA/McbA family metallohydrolase, partial [Bdellovibrionota bacterium]
MPAIIDSKASPEFSTINLASVYNRKGISFTGAELADEGFVGKDVALTGYNVLRGIPFNLGMDRQNNVLFLKDGEVTLNLESPINCRHLVFMHTAVTKRTTPDPDGITRPPRGGVILGDKVAEYQLIYTDDTVQAVPILRRFAIGDIHTNWGESCFEAFPMAKHVAIPTTSESMSAGTKPAGIWGHSQTRVGYDPIASAPVRYWIYAMQNQNVNKAIKAIKFVPYESAVLLLGLSITSLEENPLRWGRRQKAIITVPEGVNIGKPDESGRYPGLGIDLGQIISVSPKLDYENANWGEGYNNKFPTRTNRQFVVEYTSHPSARFTVKENMDISFPVKDCQTADKTSGTFMLEPINPAEQNVTIKVIEAKSKKKVAVKLHIHGEAGEHLPPMDRHRIPNPFWFEDYSPDFLAGNIHLCTYIDGETRVNLPLGNVYIEISKGFEIKPVRIKRNITTETEEIVIEIEHLLPWRENGWVSADTHVHFLSPQTALLEGAGEGVNIINLLASQWGELFTNVGDFDGKTTFGSKEAGGDGEYLVRVGTENRQQVLGHISLIGYNGRIITPLTTAGPDEAALGDPVEVTLSQWAEQCKGQGGIVVLPHFPNPRSEHAASIVLERIDAVEMTSWGDLYSGINPYSLSDWYRYLNCGYFLAAVGGTDKMSATTAVGTVRTYAQIEDGIFTYDAWKESVRKGRTFATYGPLLEFWVDGKPMGSRFDLSATGGTLDVQWHVSTVTVPFTKVELVVNGETREVVSISPDQADKTGSFSVKVDKSSWLALRVRGHYPDKHEAILAHSSPVMVKVDGTEFLSPSDALTILEQIEGAMAFVDTIATKAQAKAYKAVKMTLTSAHREIHNRMHKGGVYHDHAIEHDDHKH